MPKSRQQNVALMKELIFPLRLHLYHLSEITVLHETAQNAGFSRLFDAFFKPFHEMPKKKTVNLILKNAILCLTFAFREQIRFFDGRLFFEYSDALFEG